MAQVAEGRERERQLYFRRVGGLRNDHTLEQEIEDTRRWWARPTTWWRRWVASWRSPTGSAGFLVLANDWASPEDTLRSYELMARQVMPRFNGMIDPLRRSYDTVVANKASYGGPVMTAIARAYEDAGQPLPDGMSPANLR